MPKPAILYYSLLLCLLVMSCDDNESESLVLMTVEVAADAMSNGEQKWICITDEAGNILDEEPLLNGETVELKSTSVPEFVDVTLYSLFPGNHARHIVSTYKNIPSMKHLLIKASGPGPGISEPLPLGQATYVIHNFPTVNTEADIYEAVSFNTGITYYQSHVAQW